MRTRYLDENGNPRYSNRLLQEHSPYLIQHGHNPVDWYPWGDEALARARDEDKPVFLSIGYSTCHWCHVMEDETFDNEQAAALLNAGFVPVKVDREQRPDVDDIYMTGLQLTTGSGGWPISCFLLPDGRPFFAGTYFPAANFMQILERIALLWTTRRDELEDSAQKIALEIDRHTSSKAVVVDIGGEMVQDAARQLCGGLNGETGGFGTAPKFPQEPRLKFLFDAVLRGDIDFSDELHTTLGRMASGGIYDQVGGGFHRYSVDGNWQIPHFEKMLYNQAQLAEVYCAAYRLTGDLLYRRVVDETMGFVLREMTDENGAFFSASDADSEGSEGLFFSWSPEELNAVLGDEPGALAVDVFGVTASGNFEGRNIPHLPQSFREYAAARGLDLSELLAKVDEIRSRLYEARERRVHPLIDDKIMTGWNGMMISSLVGAADALRESSWLDAAVRAGEYIWKQAWSDDRGLARVTYHGSSDMGGTLEDYALFSCACIDLFDGTADRIWLQRADLLIEQMIALFWDDDEGGFFMGRADEDVALICRPKSPMDGATASGNGVAVNALVGLFERTGKIAASEKIQGAIQAFSGLIMANPHGFASLLTGLNRFLRGSTTSCQYGAGGAVRGVLALDVDGAQGAAGTFQLRLTIAPGWHIAASDSPGDDKHPVNQSPLKLEAVGESVVIEDLVYPEALSRQFTFDPSPWLVYEGDIVITGRVLTQGQGDVVRALSLQVQVCSEDLCAAPESLRFILGRGI